MYEKSITHDGILPHSPRIANLLAKYKVASNCTAVATIFNREIELHLIACDIYDLSIGKNTAYISRECIDAFIRILEVYPYAEEEILTSLQSAFDEL